MAPSRAKRDGAAGPEGAPSKRQRGSSGAAQGETSSPARVAKAPLVLEDYEPRRGYLVRRPGDAEPKWESARRVGQWQRHDKLVTEEEMLRVKKLGLSRRVAGKPKEAEEPAVESSAAPVQEAAPVAVAAPAQPSATAPAAVPLTDLRGVPISGEAAEALRGSRKRIYPFNAEVDPSQEDLIAADSSLVLDGWGEVLWRLGWLVEKGPALLTKCRKAEESVEAERPAPKAKAKAMVTPLSLPAGVEDILPPGWVRRESKTFPGKYYFTNNDTGQTSWRVPS